MLVNLKLSEQT